MAEGYGRAAGIAAPLALAALAFACSANRMQRPVSVEEHPDYSLAFIEFDDQGELWAPSQLERALALLEARNRAPLGMALVVFVHGWNSSVSPREDRSPKGTLHQFREVLIRIRKQNELHFPGQDFPVMGILLGWRGKVSSVPLLRELSFYNRRGAAERIAGASATEAIYRILTQLRDNPRSRSVLIGHSFGSMILERALAQAVVGALLAAPGQELIFPADLVVLLNPAGSANQAKQLVDILARNRLKTYRVDDQGHRLERPLLVSLTSERDTATRVFFPMGMRVKAINKKFRAYGSEYCSAISGQRWLYTHTAGHTAALHSHVLTVGAKRAPGPRSASLSPPGRVPFVYETAIDPLTGEAAYSFAGENHRFTIKRKPRALNDTPYWIMQVPQELISGHSDIFSGDILAAIEAIFALSGALETEVTTTVVREDGVRPVAVVPRPDGSALFLDRSRAVYAVRPDSPRPVFLSCLRESIDPGDGIGFHVAGHLAYAALSRAVGDGCRTEVYEFEVGNEGYRQLSHIRLAGSDCFLAAAFDVPAKRVLLSHTAEDDPGLFEADLTRDLPKPARLLDLPGTLPATALHFDSSAQRLFLAQGENGRLWAVDLAGETPRLDLLADSLGWPIALGFGGRARRLYVSDLEGRQIWTLDCQSRCGEPEILLQSDSLAQPSTLAVALDGTVWLGDLQAQMLLAISPDGRVVRTIRTLSGAPPG